MLNDYELHYNTMFPPWPGIQDAAVLQENLMQIMQCIIQKLTVVHTMQYLIHIPQVLKIHGTVDDVIQHNNNKIITPDCVTSYCTSLILYAQKAIILD